jgi:Icc-related predicted phosphoesterase
MGMSEREDRDQGPAYEGEERRRSDRRRPLVRIAAVGDFHCGENDSGLFRGGFASVNDRADVLLLAGDLTRWGSEAEMKVVLGELQDVEVPIVAVLGNHDYEGNQIEAGVELLRERGVHVLDGDVFLLNDQVGIAGVKGFMGGFGRRTLTAFGEAPIKEFVNSSLEEVKKLEIALRRLPTPVRVALLHYAPIAATVEGEPEQIFPFLGTDRLADPLDRFGATVAFHGHAHHGSFRGETPGGCPVFNVSLQQIRHRNPEDFFYLHEIDLEDAPRPADQTTTAAGQPS